MMLGCMSLLRTAHAWLLDVGRYFLRYDHIHIQYNTLFIFVSSVSRIVETGPKTCSGILSNLEH